MRISAETLAVLLSYGDVGAFYILRHGNISAFSVNGNLSVAGPRRPEIAADILGEDESYISHPDSCAGL